MTDSGQGGDQDGAESGLGGIQDWGYLVLHDRVIQERSDTGKQGPGQVGCGK